MLKKWYFLALAVVIIEGCLTAHAPAYGAEDLSITLVFSNGIQIQAETVDGQPDAFWAKAAAGTPLDHVLVRFDGPDGMRLIPQSGT